MINGDSNIIVCFLELLFCQEMRIQDQMQSILNLYGFRWILCLVRVQKGHDLYFPFHDQKIIGINFIHKFYFLIAIYIY